MKRRDFFKYAAALGAVLRGRSGAAATPAPSVGRDRGFGSQASRRTGIAPGAAQDLRADYIVVGSGAGGGTVAARLVEAGYRVLVLEAGGDPQTITGGDPLHPDANTYQDDYDVPAFHPLATENDAIKWDFFVRHYEDSAQQRKDANYVAEYRASRSTASGIRDRVRSAAAPRTTR